MTARSISTLKSYFETLDVPTQSQYEDLIDSFWPKVSSDPIELSAPLRNSQEINGSIVSAYSFLRLPALTTVTAVGTSQATGVRISAQTALVVAVSAGANACVLINTTAPNQYFILNANASDNLNVYPSTGQSIGAGSTNAAYVLSAYSGNIFYYDGTSRYYVL